MEGVSLHVGADEFYDVVHRGAGLKDCGYAEFFQGVDILVGNDAADEHEHVVHFILLEKVHHARDDGVVRARQNREADHLDVFLHGRADDHLRSLAQAGVDDFHAGVAQGTGNYFRAAIMAVESGLGHQHADLEIGHRDHLITEGANAEVRGQNEEVLTIRCAALVAVFEVNAAIRRNPLNRFDVEAAPEIPAGYAAIGFPRLGDFFHLRWRGEVDFSGARFSGGAFSFLARGFRNDLRFFPIEVMLEHRHSYAVVAGGQNVLAFQGEHEEHVGGPHADAFYLRQVRDDFIVGLLGEAREIEETG